MTQEHEEYYRPASSADEELVPFDVQGYAGRKGIWLLGFIIIIMLGILALLFKTYQPGVRDRGDAPKIIAENTPYKVEPENPGGEEVPHQDMEIFEAMNGAKETKDATVTDSTEVPIARPGTVQIDVQDRPSDTQATDTQSQPAEVKPPKPVAAPTPAPVQSGSDSRHVVQLASLRSRASAEETWAAIQSKHASIIPSGGYADIKRADVADKGIYYRLRLAGLTDKAMADRICNQLKARNQTCFTTTK